MYYFSFCIFVFLDLISFQIINIFIVHTTIGLKMLHCKTHGNIFCANIVQYLILQKQ